MSGTGAALVHLNEAHPDKLSNTRLGGLHTLHEKESKMHVLNIVASPRKEKSVSAAIVDAFLSEYKERAGNLLVDTLDIWQERLPEFDFEAINAKYKGVSGEPMTPVETATWEKIRELSSRFQGQTVSFWEYPCGISLSLTN